MEYKFNFWDKEHKEMYKWEQIKNEFALSDLDCDELVPLRYTGFKDLEDEGINVGDIVEYLDGEYSFIGFVIENSYGFAIRINDDYVSFEDVSGGLKVKGNIFQNADILRQLWNCCI